ncbi:class I SAM-dependent methyltransferase, partial [bacterium]|nr:class I SAM-dependent methyltransferase [bacterium]
MNGCPAATIFSGHTPLEVSQAIGEKLVSEAGGAAARVLEIGVGTGRIAWPVAAAGGYVVGFDISPNMLDEVAAVPQASTRGGFFGAYAGGHAAYPTNSEQHGCCAGGACPPS